MRAAMALIDGDDQLAADRVDLLGRHALNFRRDLAGEDRDRAGLTPCVAAIVRRRRVAARTERNGEIVAAPAERLAHSVCCVFVSRRADEDERVRECRHSETPALLATQRSMIDLLALESVPAFQTPP